MIANWIFILPLIYIVLFIIGAILNRVFDWGLEWSDFSFITAIIMVLCVICFLITTGCCIDTIVNENAIYAERLTEYNTLTNIIKTSTDVVKDGIYGKILEYNTNIISTQQKINNPAYSIMSHFLKCDWGSLSTITLN